MSLILLLIKKKTHGEAVGNPDPGPADEVQVVSNIDDDLALVSNDEIMLNPDPILMLAQI